MTKRNLDLSGAALLVFFDRSHRTGRFDTNLGDFSNGVSGSFNTVLA
jgi:hypothetical protein